MKDIIAAQHVQRRSKPSLLSTAKKYKSLQHTVPVLGDNSFIADQHLPKRKKKRLLEKVRSSVNLQNQFFARTKRKPLRETVRQGKIAYGETPILTAGSAQELKARESVRQDTDIPGAMGSFFARLPKKIILIGFLCLSAGCFALVLNYIPEPEPPEERAARFHNAYSRDFGGEGDEIPLDMTETFAWQSYTVRSGDSVEGISKRFGLSLDAVIASNDLRNVRKLLAGHTLRIPNMDGIPYKVKNGDSYSKIAESFGVSLEAILDANDIQSDAITMDTVLFIPGARMDKNELRQALGEAFIWPISGRRSSGFGWRNDPFSGARSFHAGLDIVGPVGLSVKASADGRVTATGYNATFGNFVIIKHSQEYETMYAHLNRILVKNGTYVNQGAIIGQVGNTGKSTGPHLHFAVYKNKRAINPLEVLNQ